MSSRNITMTDASSLHKEQGERCRQLFAAVVLATLDDAMRDNRKYGSGVDQIRRWANSRDGQEVLACAGIDPTQRAVQGLMAFVEKGVPTSEALGLDYSVSAVSKRNSLKNLDRGSLA